MPTISPNQGQQPPWGEDLEGPHQMLAFTQSHKKAANKAPPLIIYSHLHTGRSKPPRLASHLQVQALPLTRLARGSSVRLGSGCPRCVHSGAQHRAVPPGGAPLPAMAEEQASQHKPSQVATLSRPPASTGQSKFMAKPGLNGERRGATLPPGRGVRICQANRIIALVFWIFLKRPHVILMFSQGSEP